MKTLSTEQCATFERDGFLLLSEAFPRADAPRWIDAFWDAAPIDRTDRTTWEQQRYLISRSFGDGSFWSPKALGALDDLLGPGRYAPPTGTGWVLIGLPGFVAPPWQPPTAGWHIDGIHFHHHIHSREQALIGLFLFTDVAEGGGATVVKPGSHLVTSRLLAAAEPAGMDVQTLAQQVAEATADFPIHQVPGNAGDLLLMHPHLFHGSSDNCSERVRFASNVCVAFREVMCLDPSAALYPVERAVVAALQTVPERTASIAS